MKTRSLTSRNFFGGFFGGFLGMLTFYFIWRPLIPISCLLGILVGFYYDLMVNEIRKSWDATEELYRNRINLIKSFLSENCEDFQSKMSDYEITMARLITGTIQFFNLRRSQTVQLIIKMSGWYSAHPMNRAWIASISTSATFLMLFVLSFPWFKILIEPIAREDWRILYPLLWMIVFFTTVCAPVLAKSSQDMRDFYREYEFVAQYGALRLYLRNLWVFSTTTIAFLMLFSSLAITFIVGGIIALAYMGLSALFLGLARGIARTLLRSEHWLCLVTTLTTTVSSAIMFQNVHNPLLQWIVSLTTGLAAGCFTAWLSRVLSKWQLAKAWTENISQISLDTMLVEPTGKVFLGALSWQEDKILQPIVSKIHGFI
jgi:hypothetical protein